MRRRLAILALLAGMAASLVWQVRLETRLSVFFLGQTTAGEEWIARLQQSAFARRYLLGIEPRTGRGSGLAEVARQYVLELAGVNGVVRVWPAFQPPFGGAGMLTEYARYAPLIYSLDPAAEAGRLLTPASLPQRAAELRQALVSPFGDLIQALAPRDPLLLTLHAFADWRDRLTPAVRREGLYPLVLESGFGPFDIDRQRILQADLRQAFARLNRRHGGDYRLRMTGVPVFAVAAQSRIQRDVSRVTLASALGVMAVLLGWFRSWRSLPAVALVLAFACTAGALVTQWVFGYVHGLSLALGATLIGVCVDYPVHLLAHCRPGRTAAQVARRLWPALALGAVTTLVGYLALAATGYPGFQQTAALAGAGILAALLATRYLLPAWFAGGGWAGPPRLPVLDAWFGLCHRQPRRVLGGVGLLLAVALIFLPRLEWLDDLERLADIDPDLLREDRALRSHLDDLEPGRAVLVAGADLETALRRAEAATRALRRLKAEGKLDGFHAIYPWLVSRALQEENWRHYRARITPRFTAAWREALRSQGLAVEPLALAVPGIQPPRWLEPEAAFGAGAGEVLAGQVGDVPGGVHLALWLGPHEPAAVAAGVAGLAGVTYFSQRDRLNALAERYRRRAVWALGVGLGVIVVLLAARYRSLARPVGILLPGLVGLVFIFACFAGLGQPVSFFHLIAALLAVAICVDYGIFYTERRAGDALVTYRAMSASMLTTVTAFASLGLAANPVLRMLSVAVTAGVVTGFLLCPALIATTPGRSAHA